jgi:nucleoside-diphosphate-sugar epimerase
MIDDTIEALVYALSAPAHVQVRNLNYHIPFTFNTK